MGLSPEFPSPAETQLSFQFGIIFLPKTVRLLMFQKCPSLFATVLFLRGSGQWLKTPRAWVQSQLCHLTGFVKPSGHQALCL